MHIPIAQVINRAKIRLGLEDTTAADAKLEKFINEGAMHLDALSTYKISCATLDIDCQKAQLPNEATEIICFSFPDSSGCTGCCSSSSDDDSVTSTTSCGCFTYYVANRSILTAFCGTDSNTSCGLYSAYFDIQNGYIHFPSSNTATTVRVYYRGWNVDSDGLMLIDERKERGLSAYAAYEYACSGSNAKYYTSKQIDKWESTWIQQKSWIKGTDQVEDAKLHKDTLSAIANAILINPLLVLNRNI